MTEYRQRKPIVRTSGYLGLRLLILLGLLLSASPGGAWGARRARRARVAKGGGADTIVVQELSLFNPEALARDMLEELIQQGETPISSRA